jgi:hypothetical protein
MLLSFKCEIKCDLIFSVISQTRHIPKCSQLIQNYELIGANTPVKGEDWF